jgi:DNA modification methylase
MAMNEQTLFDDVKIQKFRLDELHPADYNPRVVLKPGDKEFEKLKKSIGKFGVVELIVVNTANNNTVVSGHQRLNVLKAMGKKEATCLVVELDEEDERSLNIAMNKINGEWDIPKLATLLEQIKDMGRLADTGFDPEEADVVFSKVHDKKVKEDNFDIDSELKQKTFSKEGDMWLIGKHRVVCGDSTGEEVYTRLMDGQKANMVLTDPPYGVDVEETAGKIKNDNLPDAEFHDFLLSAFRCMHANLDDEGSIYVWHADTKGRIFREAYEEAGFYLSGCCIWKKNALVLGRSPYQWIHEPCLYGWKKGGTHKWFGDRKQVTVWEYDKPKSSPDHPTTKPVALMAYPMKNSTTANGIVLDPFLGSGSTLIACMEMGRVCRGIELDPKFVDVIVKRAIAHNDGKYDDVFVIRDGQKLRFDEVASFEPEEVQGDDE